MSQLHGMEPRLALASLSPKQSPRVFKAGYANGINNEFAERAKVAAWLIHLVVDDIAMPDPTKL